MTQAKQKACNDEYGLFETLGNGVKLQSNETIKSLQFCKLVRHYNENAEEWMGSLTILATKCNYNDTDRQLKQPFIQGLNDSGMMVEITRKLTKGQNKDATSNQILLWAS